MQFIEHEISGDLWPLYDGAVSPEQLLAGRTLRDWQVEMAPDEVYLYSNAWVDASDWELLLEKGENAKLVTESGQILAYRGDLEIAEEAIVSAKSRLVCHPWDLIYVNEQVVSQIKESLHQGEVSPAAYLEGNLILGEGSRVLPGVFIEGNVVIGKDCKIGPNCYIRGNTTIGDKCHIGQAVEVKNSIIGHGSSVGHLSYVGDSVLGNKVNFGAATVTSNLRHDGKNHRSMTTNGLMDTGRRKFGTIVGDGVHTGIHTAIYPGRKLGPGTSTLPNESVQYDLKENEN